jgi:hypothetical protein
LSSLHSRNDRPTHTSRETARQRSRIYAANVKLVNGIQCGKIVEIAVVVVSFLIVELWVC